MPARPRDPNVERVFYRFADEYLREHERLDLEQEDLRQRRNNMIRLAYRSGLSFEQIGEALQLTRQQVSRIVRPR